MASETPSCWTSQDPSEVAPLARQSSRRSSSAPTLASTASCEQRTAKARTASSLSSSVPSRATAAVLKGPTGESESTGALSVVPPCCPGPCRPGPCCPVLSVAESATTERMVGSSAPEPRSSTFDPL